MKKVLVISSSPRKGGNSDLLCEAFAEGARKAGCSVEKVRLEELKIGTCKSCYACAKGHRCVFSDDAPALIDKFLAADVVVLGTPVYFYSMSAQLKAFIDRTVSVYGTVQPKDYYYLVSLGDPEGAHALRTKEALDGFLECHSGQFKGMVTAPGLYDPGAVKDTPAYQEALELGASLGN